MSTFRRSGHFRTNKNGTTFWVNDHCVSRDEWGGYSCFNSFNRNNCNERRLSSSADSKIESHCAKYSSFLNPNATCPVCGDPVFYYESPDGGRVFFDSLGPPWPKHQCTSNNKLKATYTEWHELTWRPFYVTAVKQYGTESTQIRGRLIDDWDNVVTLHVGRDEGAVFSGRRNLCQIRFQSDSNATLSSFELVGINILEHLVDGRIETPPYFELEKSVDASGGVAGTFSSIIFSNCPKYSSFVAPNANCPGCGQKVFFYQTDDGKGVYFDRLGPPWPKHKCPSAEVVSKADSTSNYLSWGDKSWQPFYFVRIEGYNVDLVRIFGRLIKDWDTTINVYVKKKHRVLHLLGKRLCHIKYGRGNDVLLSTFALRGRRGEFDVEEQILIGSVSPPWVEKMGNDEKKEEQETEYVNVSTMHSLWLKGLWIKIQIASLENDFKELDHLVEFQDVYKEIMKYFENIYLGVNEGWMHQLRDKHNLPYPQKPKNDWFENLKQEQKRLEEKWNSKND